MHIIKSGTDTVVPESLLLEKLKRGEELNIKLGVDPTPLTFISATPSRCVSSDSSKTSVIALR